jgi:hypothetical protein
VAAADVNGFFMSQRNDLGGENSTAMGLKEAVRAFVP